MKNRRNSQADGVRICDAEGLIAEIADSSNLQRAAMEWSYTVRNRARWKQLRRANEVADRAREELVGLGVTEAALGRIAGAGRVEVQARFREERFGWAGRVMPWEYLLSASTRRLRTHRPLTVLRQLEPDEAGGGVAPANAGLFICCNPGVIDETWDFSGEFELVENALRSGDGLELSPLNNPTLDEIRSKVAAIQPSVVHVVGVDAHQGAAMFGIRRTTEQMEADEPKASGEDERIRDGLVLAGDDGGPVIVGIEALAEALTSGGAPPRLIAFNVYNSGARIAPMTVARGAGAAIGFQDTIDDYFAEQFFIELYASWATLDRVIGSSFEYAWSRAQRHAGELTGTGIVVWSASSHLAEMRPARERLTAFEKEWTEDAEYKSGVLRVVVEERKELNYSLLHNRQPMFRKFELAHLGRGVLRGVMVNVEVYAGAETLRFSRTYDVPATPLDISKDVFVPLTSGLFRSLKESLLTSMTVNVLAPDGEQVHHKPFRVVLLPLNEWVDDSHSRHWLPSFVHPLDPAVARVIREAQPFLEAIADDPAAGFDGYQSIDDGAEDPTARVDHQVGAIWAALLERLPLRYINPPPTYTKRSQRVRTPSSSINGGRATCIDLALLMAACLEYIDIYPVIFLIEGHAFPGYWRSASSWQEFQDISTLGEMDRDVMRTMSETSRELGSRENWRSSSYLEIMNQARQGNLAPLESVLLTTRGSFADAQAEGWENLLVQREFDCMIDIIAARHATEPVTPMPLLEAGE